MAVFSKVGCLVSTFVSCSFALLLKGNEDGKSQLIHNCLTSQLPEGQITIAMKCVIDMNKRIPSVKAMAVVTGTSWFDPRKDVVPKKRSASHRASLLAVDRSILCLIFSFLQNPRCRSVYAKMIDPDGATPLFVASSTNGGFSIVEELCFINAFPVNKSRDYDDRGKRYDATPLWFACGKGYSRTVKVLLKQSGIDVNKPKTDDGWTPLVIACSYGHLEIVEQLLKQNEIELNKGCYRNSTPLWFACQNGHLETVAKLLAQSEIEVNTVRTDNRGTPLYIACQSGHLKVVEKLLQRNEIQVNNATTDGGTTPLYIACQNGHLKIVEKLLGRSEIAVNKARTSDGATPLYIACSKGHLEIAEKLLERIDIEVNKTRIYSDIDDDGPTPLYIACQNGRVEIVEKLLAHNEIELNKGYEEGLTPLFVACRKGHLEIVKKLAARNEIRLSLENDDTYRPLSYLKNPHRHPEIVSLLRKPNRKKCTIS